MSHFAKLSGTLANSRSNPRYSMTEPAGIEKRMGYNSCTSSQQSQLAAAAAESYTYLT